MTVSYTCTATTVGGSGGYVDPPEVTTVLSGGSVDYNFIPDPFWGVTDVKVDGGTVAACLSYSFVNVTANHTIEVTFGVPLNLATLWSVYNVLTNGMRSALNEADNAYVQTWYLNDPLSIPNFGQYLPAGAIILGKPTSRNTVFVGEDSQKQTLYIRFYQPATRKAGEPPEFAAGITRLQAQLDKAVKLLRSDPTMSGVFVNTEISDIDPMLFGDNTLRIGQITVSIISRALWN